MLKRQETLLSSSSRRQTPPPPDKYHRPKSIGCMSAVFHFLSRYQHRRKFLTFGKKHEKVAQPKSSSVSNREGHRRFSWDAPRSPAIPTEIRRSKSMNFPEHDHRSPPALVAGLQENVPTTGHFPKMEYNYSTLEKRRKLMSDLEKCNEDLKELKKTIETVRFAENLRSLPALKRLNTVKKREYYSNSEQPSPVSVLDELTRSPLISSTYSSRRHVTKGQMPMPQQQKPTARKKPGEDSALFNKLGAESLQAKREATGSQIWSSNAMVESVDEVCKDIGWGEKREIGRIGLAIQDFICRDLIEEVVKYYLGCSCYSTIHTLPLEACKKRLCF